MTADINDKLRKYKSRFSTTLSIGIGTGTSDTLTPATVTGLPTDTAITIFIDRVDSTGTKTPTKLEAIKGVVSGGNITSYVRAVEGTEQAHSGGAVIEMVWNAADWNNVVDWGLTEHNQDGTHASTIVKTTGAQSLSDKTLTTPTIDDAMLLNHESSVSTPASGKVAVYAKSDNKIYKKDSSGTETAVGGTKATASEVAIGTDDTKYTTPLAVAPYANQSMARQAIMNGNFDVWQRGTSVALADVTVTYLADRWADSIDKNTGTLPTLTRAKVALTSGQSYKTYYSSKLTTNGAGTSLGAGSYHTYSQKIENGTRYLCGDGKKVTVSFLASSSIANKKLGVYFVQAYGTGGSPTGVEVLNGTNFTLTSNLTFYSYTFTTNTLSGKTFGTNNDDYLQLAFMNMWGSTYQSWLGAGSAETYVGAGDIYIAQVQLCAGDVALPFQPKSFEEELRACMRYYEKSYSYGIAPGTASASGYVFAQGYANVANGSCYGHIKYTVPKRSASPTITIYGFGGTSGVCSNAGGGTDLAANSAAQFSSSPLCNTSVTIYNNSGGAIAPTSGGFIFHYTVSDEL